jgi:hypothetical protein
MKAYWVVEVYFHHNQMCLCSRNGFSTLFITMFLCISFSEKALLHEVS